MPTRRTDPLSFRSFWFGAISEGLLGTLLVSAVLSVFGLLLVAGFYGTQNDYADTRAGYAKTALSDSAHAHDLTEKTRATRKTIAKGLLEYETQNEKYDRSMFTDYETNQIRHMAKTGEPIKVDTHHNKYGDYFRFVYLFPGLPIFWLIVGLVLVLMYADDIPGWDKHRLADMPWDKAWSWICTLVFGPPWWITMAVSRVLMRNDPVPIVPNDEAEIRVPTEKVGNTTQIIAWPTYAVEPDVATQKYITLRQNGAREYRKSRLEAIRDSIEAAREKVKSAGQKVKERRNELAQLEAEQRELQSILEDDNVDVSTQIAEGEIAKIIALPEVIGIRATSKGLKLIVRAITAYKGDSYYIGDLEVVLKASTLSPNAKRIKSGVQKDWSGTDPVYSDSNGFCFGERKSLISDYLKKSQYYEAVVLIIDSVRSVNDVHQLDIPRAFIKLTEEQLATAYQ